MQVDGTAPLGTFWWGVPWMALWVAVWGAGGGFAGWCLPSLATRLAARWGFAGRPPTPWHRALLLLALGTAMAGVAWRFGMTRQAALAGPGLIWLGLVAAVDLQTRRIPNRLTYPAALAAPLWIACWPGATAFDHLLGAVAQGGFFALVYFIRPPALGFGDVKLAAVVGLYLGWEGAVAALYVTLLVGAGGALVALAAGKGRRSSIAYGPALAAGGALALVVGPHLWGWPV